jgi:hypothetical protein
MVPEQSVPKRIFAFLAAMGWQSRATDQNTFEELFYKNDQIHNEAGVLEDGTGGHCFRWYEAVAYEYYKMMTIGGMVGETKV